jgi:DNA-binding protein YbaB
VTPDEWLANFEAKVADVRQKAAAFKENLAASGATETSADGALRVSVAPNGALTDVAIADSAMRGSGAALAAEIMRLAREAQRAAAVRVAAAFVPLAGADPEQPAPLPAGEPRIRPARRRSGKPDDDEDFGNDQIFGPDDDF